MPDHCRVLRFRRKEETSHLDREEASALATEYLETSRDQRSVDLVDRTLRNADVLFSLCAQLEQLRDDTPMTVAEEASTIYEWLKGIGSRVGLFDESEYLLGETAYLAGGAFRFLGKRDEAFRWLDRAEAAYRHTINPAPGLAKVAYTRLVLRYEMNQFEDVLELLPSLGASFRRLGMSPDVLKCGLLEAESHKQCGRIAEAYSILQLARDENFPSVAEPGLRGQVLVRLGEYKALEGDTAAALATYHEALPLLQQGKRSIALAHLKVVVGETLRINEQLNEALESYREATVQYSALSMPTWVAHVRVLAAEILLSLDRPREAEWEILAALPTIEEQKMVPEGFAAVALLKESVRRRKTDPNALRELREHLQATK